MKLTLKEIREIIREELLESSSVATQKAKDWRDDEEIGYDEEEMARQGELEINWLPEFVGEIEIDMPTSKIPLAKKGIIGALGVLQKKAPEEFNFVQKYLNCTKNLKL